MRLVAIESALLTGLLLLSAYVLWASLSVETVRQQGWVEVLSGRLPEYASLELGLAGVLCVAAYWILQVLGHTSTAFWLMTLLVILPQAPAIWSHNQLQWLPLIGMEGTLNPTHSQLWQAALFLGSLVGLMVLYRLLGLRVLNRQLKLQGANDEDRRRVMVAEALMLPCLTVVGLLLAFLIVIVANSLGKIDTLLQRSPWGVLTIGGGATLLLILTLAFWFRYRNAPPEDLQQRHEDSAGSRRDTQL